MNELISVIVPVYNVEKYLDECIESIIKQTYKKLEIILVDDGSKDKSGEKCDQWKSLDNRIKVIHKKNAGLGYARNSGIEVAEGQYILYIDSDDYIEKNMVEKLHAVAQKTSSDTVFCGLKRVMPDGTSFPIPAYYDNKTFENEEILKNVLLEMIGSKPNENEDALLFMSVWHALYSAKIIKDNNIRFPSEREIMCEDIIYHINYLPKAKKVAYISDCLYCYRVNVSSLSQRYDESRFERQKILSKEICRQLSTIMDASQYIEREQRRFLGGTRAQIQAIVASKEKHQLRIIKSICDDSFLREVLKSYPYAENPFKHKIFNRCLDKKNVVGLWLLAKMAISRRNN